MNEQEAIKQYGQLVAKAWSDAAFKERLLTDPAGMLREQGFDVPAAMQVRVLEPGEARIYVPLPAWAAAGDQPEEWVQLVSRAQAEPGFKARLLAESDAVLAELGMPPPAGVPVEVVEVSDTQGYIVVPPAPEELDADSLDDVAGYFSCCSVKPREDSAVTYVVGGGDRGPGDFQNRVLASDLVAAHIHRPFSLR